MEMSTQKRLTDFFSGGSSVTSSSKEYQDEESFSLVLTVDDRGTAEGEVNSSELETEAEGEVNGSDLETGVEGEVIGSDLETEAEGEVNCSELETGSDDGNMSTSVYVPAPKRIKSSSGGKHRKSGFDPKWTSEFKWLERVEIDG